MRVCSSSGSFKDFRSKLRTRLTLDVLDYTEDLLLLVHPPCQCTPNASIGIDLASFQGPWLSFTLRPRFSFCSSSSSRSFSGEVFFYGVYLLPNLSEHLAVSVPRLPNSADWIPRLLLSIKRRYLLLVQRVSGAILGFQWYTHLNQRLRGLGFDHRVFHCERWVHQ